MTKGLMGWFVIILCIWFCFAPSSFAQWSKTNMPDGGFVYGLTTVGNILFAATSNGVFRSDDYGANWSPTAFPHVAVRAIAGKDGRLFVGQAGGVAVSTDLGATWTLKQVTELAAAVAISTDADGIWASAVTPSNGRSFIWHSTNYGNSWQAVANMTGGYDDCANAIVVDSNHIFAGSSNGLIVSDRLYGTYSNWYPVHTDIYLYGLTLTSNKLYGASWGAGKGVLAADIVAPFHPLSSTGLGNLDMHSVFVDAAAGSNIYGCSRSGLYRSDNNGTSWTLAGLPHTDIFTMIRLGTHLFVAAGCGVVRSDDNGSTWFNVNNGLRSEGLYDIMTSGNDLIVGTPSGIFRSSDNAASWTNIGLDHEYVLCLGQIGSDLYAGTRNGFYRSSDNGVTWDALAEGMDQSTYSMLVSPTMILRSGYFSAGLYRSIDHGATWLFDENAPSWPTCFAQVGSTLFLGFQGMRTSTNNGTYWMYSGILDLGDRFVNALAVVGSDVYAAAGGLVWVSHDVGGTWSTISSGLPSSPSLGLIASGDTLYTFTNEAGVYYLAPGDPLWTPVNSVGLVDTRLTSVAVCNGFLYTVTQAGRPGVAQDGGRDLWVRPMTQVFCCNGKTGNVDQDATVNLGDLSALVSFLGGSGYILPCTKAADINANGIVNLADLSSLVSYLTGGGYSLPDCS